MRKLRGRLTAHERLGAPDRGVETSFALVVVGFPARRVAPRRELPLALVVEPRLELRQCVEALVAEQRRRRALIAALAAGVDVDTLAQY